MVSARSKIALVRTIKVLHTVGAIGAMGGVATFLVLRHEGAAGGGAGFLAVAHAIDAAYRYLVIPSLVACVLSGLLSMVVHRAYWNAVWAWLKAASGIVVIEIAFRMHAVARGLGEPAVLEDHAALREALHTETKGLWLLVVILLGNVVIGIYRPRLVGANRR